MELGRVHFSHGRAGDGRRLAEERTQRGRWVFIFILFFSHRRRRRTAQRKRKRTMVFVFFLSFYVQVAI